MINGFTGTELLFDIPLTVDSWNNEIFAPEDQLGSFDKELGTALCK